MFSELLHETLILLLTRALRLLSPQGVPTQRSTNNAFSLIGHASLSQHKLSKATPTKGHFATWLAHSLPEPIYLKASEQHRGIGIMRRTNLRTDGCNCLKFLEVCEFGGNEDGAVPLYVQFPMKPLSICGRPTGTSLPSNQRHKEPQERISGSKR